MLLTKTIKVKWNPKNKDWYESKGYKFTKWKDEFEVKVEDLSESNSTVRVEVLCDYCLEEGKETIIKKSYHTYIQQNKNSIIHKDCCKKCSPKKVKEISLVKYGVESFFQTYEFKEKNKQTNLEKYGEEYYAQTEDFREKFKNTCQEKYGVDNVFQLEEVKEKSKKTTLNKYGKEHYTQTEEYIEKTINTNREKYGTDWANQNKEIRAKIDQTNLDRYGYIYPNQSREVREKTEQTNLLRYGNKYAILNNDVQDKIKDTIKERFNVENVSQNDKIKKKKEQTFLKHYGVTHPMKDKKLAKKYQISRFKNMYKNGTAPCSTQQKYLYELLGGELNYPVDNCLLDIAFIDEKIYVEYDGSGHDLRVKFGSETQESFNKKNKKRSYFLSNRGWKEIRIISNKDLLPSDEKILEIIQFAKDYLNTDHHYIKFDIDNSKIKCSQFEKDYDFGELRIIKNINQEVM